MLFVKWTSIKVCSILVILACIYSIRFIQISEMGKVKKETYTEVEKKGLSQARNLGTDRVMKKIKQLGSITGHKV